MNRLKKLWLKLTSYRYCKFDDLLCLRKQSGFGCVCGKGSSKKEDKRADDIARQERERAEAQANQVRAQQEAAANQLRQELQQIAATNPLEAQRIAYLMQAEPEFARMFSQAAQGGVQGRTPLEQELEARLRSDLSRDVSNTFAPNLQLLQGEVGKFAARRGIVGSGLELEKLGRTGSELAIQQAMGREQLRAQQVQQAIQGQSALEATASGRRGEAATYLRGIQGLEDTRRGREQQILSSAATGGADLRQQGNISALDRLSTGSGRAMEIESAQLARQAQARASQERGIASLAGTAVGAGAGFFLGGPMGAMYGAQIGQGAFGGGGGGMPFMIPGGGMGGPAQAPSGGQMRAQYKYGSQRVGPYNQGPFIGNWG